VEFIKVEPLGGGTKTKEFSSKFATQLVPALEDGNIHLTEASAIMTYLVLLNTFLCTLIHVAS